MKSGDECQVQVTGHQVKQGGKSLSKGKNAEKKAFHLGAPVPNSHHLATGEEGFICEGGANKIIQKIRKAKAN